MTFEEVETAIREQAQRDAEGGDDDLQAFVEEMAERSREVHRLRGALRRLEEIYNTDRIAAEAANEIETIFDEHLHSPPGSDARDQ